MAEPNAERTQISEWYDHVSEYGTNDIALAVDYVGRLLAALDVKDRERIHGSVRDV